jgi:hypothetical protein
MCSHVTFFASNVTPTFKCFHHNLKKAVYSSLFNRNSVTFLSTHPIYSPSPKYPSIGHYCSKPKWPIDITTILVVHYSVYLTQIPLQPNYLLNNDFHSAVISSCSIRKIQYFSHFLQERSQNHCFCALALILLYTIYDDFFLPCSPIFYAWPKEHITIRVSARFLPITLVNKILAHERFIVFLT